MPAHFILEGIDSWVCGKHSQVSFLEGDSSGSYNGFNSWASSGSDYIYNDDLSASKKPLNDYFSKGPITKV